MRPKPCWTRLEYESLELLLVAEENHNLWQLLRLAHVRQAERSHFAATLDDARAAIAVDDTADQALVASLSTLLSGLWEPGGTEGLALLQAPRLRTKATELADTLTWFGRSAPPGTRSEPRGPMARVQGFGRACRRAKP